MQENTIRQLIEVEQERLKIAVAWEKEKKIPNPETSVIIQSILKLDEKLNIKDGNRKEKESRQTTNSINRFTERLEGINL